MSFPKLLGIIAVLLFGLIAIVALFKDKKSSSTPKMQPKIIEVELEQDIRVVTPPQQKPKPVVKTASAAPAPANTKKNKEAPKKAGNPIVAATMPSPVPPPPAEKKAIQKTVQGEKLLPDADRIDELFTTSSEKLPIVETITYKSRVPWQQGRPAWLSDYARYYQTSRHFIARSLNGKPDYFKQDLVENARFNVLRQDKNLQFYLLVDLSRCRMWFYYDDLDLKERVLLKTYQVGIGRVDGSKASGFLTPLGKYTLGNKVAIYKPKMMGPYNGEQAEMISIFGTRWIPFDKEVKGCSSPAKGLGIHGVPWTLASSGERVQDRNSLGKYQSDGCVRLASEDMEELFAVIITKPTVIELVKDFYDAKP